jgi:crotonobetainyl-CoA:carnitine CoA-transferase CaiB-like acyl-CoA transferase
MGSANGRGAALAGIKIIDLSHQAAGPWCTSLLGDLGADVIKIEKPGRGDGIRHAGKRPPELGSLNFVGLNRNKRGITIDIGQEAGCVLVRRLAAQADVVVENFRPGVMERHGLGWETLRALNPRLVYCSITAFGPRGPLAQKPGMDLIIQATAGLMGHTGEPDGPPIKSAPPVADITTGIYGAYGVLAALFEREHSGVGQKVEIAMLDAVISMFSDIAANVLTDGTKYGKFGTGHPDLVPYQAFPATDGYFVVACLTNAFYNRLCAALERPDLLQDPRFASNRERLKHRGAIVPILSEIFKTRERDHWIALLEAHDIPACRVNMLEDVLAHPQIAENDLVVTRTDQRGETIRTVGPPVKLSGTPTTFARLAPALGEHTDQVLREFGLGDAELGELRAARVI